MDKYVGKRLDSRYEIKELIGCGGMANVYSAYDIIDDREVAIKILRDEFLSNEDFIRRFKNESKAVAVLSHPNIVKVYDVSFGDRIQYIVMEIIDGITLKEFIEQQHEINWKDAVHFTVQILKALEHAHEKGVIHRDIKPQNIMLLKDGTIKVTDFGIARLQKNSAHTITNKAIGSVHYISPEQARGDITDEKSDIYSVGVMLYEMLTGKLPFEADNAVSVAIMQLQSDPVLPREINQNIPEGLEEITLKAMQKKPSYRYETAADMLAAIDTFRKNPSIRFEYTYFNDNNPTKYIDAINFVKEAKPKSNYEDDYSYSLDEKNRKSKRSKAINIVIGVGIAVVLFLILLGVGLVNGWFGAGGKDVDVPNFIGMKIENVVENSEYNFTWEIKQAYDPNKTEGVIIDQDPKAGAKKVKEDAKIVLTVNSSGAKVSVPAVKGLTLEKAKAKIKDAGLLYEVLLVEDAETAIGIVKESDPAEGTEVVVKSIVKLFVSNGASEKTVNVPNVINKSLTEATNELVACSLKVSENIIRENSSKAKDTVLSTNPLPGVEVAEGSTITLTVSSGKPDEKTLSAYVDMPKTVNHDVSVSVYVDGIKDNSKSNTVRPSDTNTYPIKLTASSGTKNVTVYLDNQKYRVYEFNFDNNIVATRESYSYNDTVAPSSVRSDSFEQREYNNSDSNKSNRNSQTTQSKNNISPTRTNRARRG